MERRQVRVGGSAGLAAGGTAALPISSTWFTSVMFSTSSVLKTKQAQWWEEGKSSYAKNKIWGHEFCYPLIPQSRAGLPAAVGSAWGVTQSSSRTAAAGAPSRPTAHSVTLTTFSCEGAGNVKSKVRHLKLAL